MRRLFLIIALVLAPLAVFAAMVLVDRSLGKPGRGFGYVVDVNFLPAGTAIDLPPIEGPMDATRPLVVIDAGHGGKDPGASFEGLEEKALTLGLALALKEELLKAGGVRVALTRGNDRYLFLAERPAIARRLGANLFISLHADSTEEQAGALGATIYTLSARGSNQAAQKMADRENAADQINGVRIKGQSDDVNAILVDLSQRETQTNSEDFARLVLREGRGLMPFNESRAQSAAFAVLKSPDVPSVLFETGYINNPRDVQRLTSLQGRRDFSEALVRAIKIYFAKGTLKQP